MCIKVDEDSDDKVARLQKANEPISGFSLKAVDKKDIYSLCSTYLWKLGLNKSSYFDFDQPLANPVVSPNVGFHFCFTKEDLATLISEAKHNMPREGTEKPLIIRVSVNPEDIRYIGVVDGMKGLEGKPCFVCTKATWDGTFFDLIGGKFHETKWAPEPQLWDNSPFDKKDLK